MTTPKEILVEGDTLPNAYHSALKMLKKYGSVVPCPDWDATNGKDGTQLEISMTMVVDNPLKEPMISRLFPGGEKELQQYVMEMVDGILNFAVTDGKWAYTYNDRMTRYCVAQHTFVDQLRFVEHELKRNPYSRRAVVDVRHPDDIGSDEPACLQHIQFFIRDGKLDCKVLFRSNDACKATFMNAFALIMIQKKMADELGVEVGTYTHRANSFHCYSKDYGLLDGYVNRIYGGGETEYEYAGEWKEEMESYIPEILEAVKEIKSRSGGKNA